jgi:hypothetical protein
MGIGERLLAFLTAIFGGCTFIIFFVCALSCGLFGLLTLCDEHYPFFRLIANIVTFLLLGFGFLLPFRSLSLAPLALAIWWALLVHRPYLRHGPIQAAILTVASFLYWIPHFSRSDDLGLLKAGDCTIFLLLPMSIVLVQLSRGSQSLSGNKGPRIPLRQFLAQLGELVSSLVPRN